MKLTRRTALASPALMLVVNASAQGVLSGVSAYGTKLAI